MADRWQNKYNAAGHVTWQGRIYGRGIVNLFFRRSRIYHGIWGSAPFSVCLRAEFRTLVINDAFAGMVLSPDICGVPDRACGIVAPARVVEPIAGWRNTGHASPSH